MKVMCIDGKCYPADPNHTPIIIEGNTYDVIDSLRDYEGGWYELTEDIGTWYAEEAFAPLSSIDETESETYKNLTHVIQ